MTNAPKTVFEVERKFRIDENIAAELPAKLWTSGFKSDGQSAMTDIMLPARQLGDILRIRQEELKQADGQVVSRNILTAKHQVTIGGTKEREETEEVIGELTKASLISLGERITGGTLPRYSKLRLIYKSSFNGRDCLVSIDDVKDLGEYSGQYVEIEVLADSTDDMEAIRKLIFMLAEKMLGMDAKPEQLSYSQMLERVWR